jgi:two-component system response regulator NreC
MKNAASVNVLLSDDHPLYRRGLSETIRRYSFINNIYEASTGLETMFALQHQQIHVVYLDCQMPDMDGIQCLPHIRNRFPGVKVIVISLKDDISTVMTMINNGAHGYLLKDKDSSEIHDATKNVLKGLKHYDKDIMKILEQQLSTSTPAVHTPIEKLTDREQEVLYHIAMGATPKEISDKIHITLPTVSQHRTSGMRKINAQSNMDVTRYYLKNGLMSLEGWLGGA